MDCHVQTAQGGGSEIMLTKHTKVQASPKKFDTCSVCVSPKEVATVSLNVLQVDSCSCKKL